LSIPLEEAPFKEYLKILRKEGYESEAQDSEELYVTLLEQFGYKKEDIYKTPFNKLVEAVETVLQQANREIVNYVAPQIGGKVLVGKDVNEETLMRVASIHSERHQEHKLRNM